MKKLFAVLLCAALVLTLSTACGSAQQATQSSSTPAPTTTTEPPVPPYYPALLTGEEMAEADYPQSQRFAAVMINNISGSASQNARPQWGIGDADILVEIKVEGGITRFMGLFSDYTKLPKVGPVRSARDQFFQIILPWQPLYIHIGESVVQTEYKKNYNYEGLDINLDHYGFERDQERLSEGRAVEHTAYTTADQIMQIVKDNDIDTKRTYNSTMFNFVHYDEPDRVLTGDRDNQNVDAYKVDIVHSEGYRTYFTYDAAAQKYMMSQYSLAKGAVHETVDANTNEQLGFKNLLVLFTDIHVYPGHEAKDLQKVDETSGGVGYYFSDGKAEFVYWKKDSPDAVLRILTKDGTEQDEQINPGKSYLTFVDLDEAPNFCYYPNEAAANGTENVQVDSNSVNTSITDD